jgi:hypothetical protein
VCNQADKPGEVEHKHGRTAQGDSGEVLDLFAFFEVDELINRLTEIAYRLIE